MEILYYCDLCGKYDDLIRWQTKKETHKTEDEEVIKENVTIATVCGDCYNRLESYTIRGWNKTKALIAVQKEIKDGKK